MKHNKSKKLHKVNCDSVIFGGSISSFLSSINDDEKQKVMSYNHFNIAVDTNKFVKYLSERFLKEFYAECGTSEYNNRDFELFWFYMLNEAL